MIDGRLTRRERTALLLLICTEAIMATVEGDLRERLEHVPGGVEKLQKALGLVTEIEKGILPTVSREQRRAMQKTMHDYELRPVPKLTPEKHNLVVEKETLKTLVDAAQDGACTLCVKDARESRDCKLQRILSVITPMNDYGGELCPFNNVGWEN